MKATISFAATLLATLLGACGDPVQTDEVAALGPEARGVRPGPTHRPGQPCLVCHGGSGPGNLVFSIGGTAYATQGSPQPLVGATVQLTDSRGSTHDATTNSVGNFYIPLAEWAPVAPIGGLGMTHEIQVCQGSCGDTALPVAYMSTHIGRDGSCADCHFSPPGPLTPGPVYLLAAP